MSEDLFSMIVIFFQYFYNSLRKRLIHERPEVDPETVGLALNRERELSVSRTEIRFVLGPDSEALARWIPNPFFALYAGEISRPSKAGHGQCRINDKLSRLM